MTVKGRPSMETFCVPVMKIDGAGVDDNGLEVEVDMGVDGTNNNDEVVVGDLVDIDNIRNDELVQDDSFPPKSN